MLRAVLYRLVFATFIKVAQATVKNAPVNCEVAAAILLVLVNRGGGTGFWIPLMPISNA